VYDLHILTEVSSTIELSRKKTCHILHVIATHWP